MKLNKFEEEKFLESLLKEVDSLTPQQLQERLAKLDEAQVASVLLSQIKTIKKQVKRVNRDMSKIRSNMTKAGNNDPVLLRKMKTVATYARNLQQKDKSYGGNSLLDAMISIASKAKASRVEAGSTSDNSMSDLSVSTIKSNMKNAVKDAKDEISGVGVVKDNAMEVEPSWMSGI